jgi:hypothetical protein
LLQAARRFADSAGPHARTHMHLRKRLATFIGLTVSLLSAPYSAFGGCADFNDDGIVSAVDALGVLQASVGIAACDSYRCDIDGNGSVSASDALKTLRIAVGESIARQCPAAPHACLTDIEFFFENIWTPILTDCIACHTTGGLAASTDLVLKPSSQSGYLDHNFNVVKNFAASTGTKEGSALLLSKPQGINHFGGQRLGITPDSVLYASLVELVGRFNDPVEDCGVRPDFWSGAHFLDDVATLNKAGVILAGRRPTAAEQAAVYVGGEAELRRTLRRMLDGPDFEAFVRETVNDHLLTDKYLVHQSNAFGVLQGEYQYPDLYERIEVLRAIYGDEVAWDAWEKTNRALAREPLELFVYVARSERPYTEVVTADYFMVNPWSNSVYRGGADFGNDWGESTWKRGANRGYRLPNYPHAGVLTSPMFLHRFPSTSTNRNRARARWVYKLFLGVDVQGLVPRVIDPAALADTDNPTLNNPNCTVCHTLLDPVAGTFQDFGDLGIYRENDSDSLPYSYKRTSLYRPGDRWYRDMLSPGFNGATVPTAEADNSIAWLGRAIAQDPRFARGAVEFWYKGVFGRPPLARPTDPSQADYTPRLAAYAAQDEAFHAIADAFAAGTAGTSRNGPFNLKDLLVEIALSPLFRIDAADDIDPRREIELEGLGLSRLLTPEQLNRKFESTTGAVWARRWDPENPDLLNRYRIFYGGIDSAGITKRATELNALMSTVPQRMAYEMACPLAVVEFSTNADDRLLFPFVEPEDLPTTTAGEARIRANIGWLHQWLLGEVLSDDAPEVTRTLAMFNEVRNLRIAANKSKDLDWGSGYCELDFAAGPYIDRDESYTIRAWIAVLSYLLSDRRFIYE